MTMTITLDVRPTVTARCGDEDVTGAPEIVGAALRRAGYDVRWTWTDMPPDVAAEVIALPDGGPCMWMRDPNDGSLSRHQYRVDGGFLGRRVLPTYDDTWDGEPAPPWWEPVLLGGLAQPNILLEWHAACGGHPPASHDRGIRDVLAWTPNGREVRVGPNGVAIQPPRDNWWHQCGTLDEARRWWYSQPGCASASSTV